MTPNKNSQGIYEHALFIVFVLFFFAGSFVLFGDKLFVLLSTIQTELRAR